MARRIKRSKKMRGTRKRKLIVKKKFVMAIKRLSKLSPNIQRAAIAQANSKFIKDVSSVMKKLRKRPDLVTMTHRKRLQKHRVRLQKLIHPKTSIQKKREILTHRGGIFPLLIPLIAAGIGAAGSVASGAVTAAIMKS